MCRLPGLVRSPNRRRKPASRANPSVGVQTSTVHWPLGERCGSRSGSARPAPVSGSGWTVTFSAAVRLLLRSRVEVTVPAADRRRALPGTVTFSTAVRLLLRSRVKVTVPSCPSSSRATSRSSRTSSAGSLMRAMRGRGDRPTGPTRWSGLRGQSLSLSHGSTFARRLGKVTVPYDHPQVATGGRLIRMASTFPPVLRPNRVPRS